MNNTWLLLDCEFLCHRAWYSMGTLSFRAVKTGVLFGFFKDLVFLQERFRTSGLVFCFDKGREGIRNSIYPAYKKKRHDKKKELTEEEITAAREYYTQVAHLRDSYLTTLGYKNVYFQHGYEGDDIIASACRNLPEGDTAIIVSADGDLYQLISPSVSFYNPNKAKLTTPRTFLNEYGIEASEWWKVKALAGCKSDEVMGIPKVGEITAIKYLKGELKRKSKTYQAIRSPEGIAIRRRNISLVKLPLKEQ